MIIAIDGPAGSGKSTTARRVAARLGYRYLDTGAMYRAFAYAAHARGLTAAAFAEALPPVHLDLSFGEEGAIRVALDGADVTDAIRTREMGMAASEVSAFPSVRAHLVAMQRTLAARYAADAGGAVLDGRDIGTVVFPDAAVKIFLDAAARERARRRLRELEARGEAADLDALEAELLQRDAQDQGRTASPLRAASDAIHLDTTGLTPEEQVDFVVRLAQERGA